MKYISTRGPTDPRDPAFAPASFEETVLSGYAKDGGLYMPATVPTIRADQLVQWATSAAGGSYIQLCKEILPLFVESSDLPLSDLHHIIDSCFAGFDDPANVLPMALLAPTPAAPSPSPSPSPLPALPAHFYVLEMWHGPTGAFKDLALSLLGRLLEYFLSKRRQHRTILVGTSGDTGSAAIHAVRGNSSVDIVVLFPKGRISRVQELQMTLVREPNVHVYAVDGSSDDLDVPIRQCFADTGFADKHSLCSINSVNWTRIMMQVVHFFFSYVHVVSRCAVQQPLPEVAMVVPTGACGNVAAGMLARAMGLPITLVAAVNANDIVHRALTTGEFSVAPSVRVSLAPSMDIQVPYNFERIVYLASDRDHVQVARFWKEFETSGRAVIAASALAVLQSRLLSCSATDEQVASTIASVHAQCGGYILDPHTAIGVYAAAQLQQQSAPLGSPAAPPVCFATATPAKFAESVLRILQHHPPLPPSMQSAICRDDPEGQFASPGTGLPTPQFEMRRGEDWLSTLRAKVEEISQRVELAGC